MAVDGRVPGAGFFGLEAEERGLLASMGRLIDRSLPELSERFYAHLSRWPETRALLDAHGDLFDVRWWLQLQQRIVGGERIDVPPYPASAHLTAAALLGQPLL